MKFHLRSKQTFAALLLASPALAMAATSTPGQYDAATKYSPLKQINKSNVAQLEVAWEYNTGETPPEGLKNSLVAFEDQPSFIDGNLVICSVSRRVIALDPATGKERWAYDPNAGQDLVPTYKECRGISHWRDSDAPATAACQSRIFLGSLDYKLHAIDARTGKPCADFGDNGVVTMEASMPTTFSGEVIAGSNPAVVNDVIVVGSAVADNQRVDSPSGRLLAFDARSGGQVWEFDPVPREKGTPAAKTWERGSGEGFGQGNVWSSMSVDNDLDLVYLPTTSPSSDFYGGDRAGDNLYTTSTHSLNQCYAHPFFPIYITLSKY